MAEIFHDKILFRSAEITTAQEIAAYNFKFQSSVEYLDLATNEILLRGSQQTSFKTPFTTEGVQKRITPERQILYKFHLDLPDNLDGFSCENRTEVTKRNVFHLKEIYMSMPIYNHGLVQHIVTAIKKDRTVEKLRSYIKIFEFLKFGVIDDAAFILMNSILPILYCKKCTDFELVINFLDKFNFILWFRNSEMPAVFEYVLFAAQRSLYSEHLWRCLDQGIDPVTFCFLCHKIQEMCLLIKYGTITFIPSYINIKKYTTIAEKIIYWSIWLKRKNERRTFFLFQLWYDFQHHRNFPEGLRSLWRDINEPFLSREEIAFTFKPLLLPAMVRNLIRHYEVFIVEKACKSKHSPRTLKNICRVEVRRLMSFSHQLPFGVDSLKIPVALKTYLNHFL